MVTKEFKPGAQWIMRGGHIAEIGEPRANGNITASWDSHHSVFQPDGSYWFHDEESEFDLIAPIEELPALMAQRDKLVDQVASMKRSGMAMLEAEMKRTREFLELREFIKSDGERNMQVTAQRNQLMAALNEIAAITRPQMCMDGSAVVGSPNATGYDFQLIARAALAAAGVA